ncbi:MAG: PD40 domain-containing protein [Candidatus Aminicenantes bacterium]|nr:PD40 domain-containing protein [Candidatus Aminicenantes bacterium]
MRHKTVFFGLFLFIIFSFTGSDQKENFPVLKGPYLGQKPPGKTPELFAPGIISTCTQHSSVYFSRDGKEVYFSRLYPRPPVIMYMCEENGQWTSPRIVCEGLTPGLAPDGKTVFFSSSKPNWKLWRMQKIPEGWTEPRILPHHINFQRRQDTPYVTADGTLYFCSMFGKADGIYRARFKNGEYTLPERIEYGISDEHGNFCPYISPDEKYLIFSSTRPGYGITDLYISFHNEDGSWTQPKNLGPKINTSAKEAFPFVSFDGKYFFFMSNRVSVLNKTPIPDGPGNVYWVDARIIDQIKLNN